MCRMIAAVGAFDKSAVIRAVDTMSRCLIGAHELSITHQDGWGAVYESKSGEIDVVRDVRAITEETATRALSHVDSPMLVIHARHATRGGTKAEYVHPIECEIRGHKAYFFHNGTFADGKAILKKDIEWDTEALLELLLPAFHSDRRDEQIRSAFADLSNDTTSVNFILAERSGLTVCEWHGQKWPQFYTMHTLRTDRFSLVSSEVIPFLAPQEKWNAVPNHTIFKLDASGTADVVNAPTSADRRTPSGLA